MLTMQLLKYKKWYILNTINYKTQPNNNTCNNENNANKSHCKKVSTRKSQQRQNKNNNNNNIVSFGNQNLSTKSSWLWTTKTQV